MNSSTDSSVTSEVLEQVENQKNFFVQFLDQINWQNILVTVILRVFQLLLVIIALAIIKKIGEYLIRTAFKQYLSKRVSMPNRFHTLYNLTENIFHAVLWFFFVYALLSLIGIPVGTLLAGAGVVGLALSLGAQGFVSDIVNGFFILLEKQLDVGDTVTINAITGTVADVNLKTTKLQDFDGTIHYIPNRQITTISNQSRENARVSVQIPLVAGADFEAVKQILKKESKQVLSNYSQVTQMPETVDIVPLDDASSLAAQVEFSTLPGEQYEPKYALIERTVEALKKAHINQPE